MKPTTYKEAIEKYIDGIMEDSTLEWSPDKRRDYILCSIVEMLAVIADILERRKPDEDK